MEIANIVPHIRHTSVLWHSLKVAARRPIQLATPAVMVFVPLNVVMFVATLPWLGDVGAVVNGEFVLFGELPTPLVGWSVAVLAVSVVALAITLAATVIVAVGLMLDRPVSPAAALRVAVWRSGASLLALAGAGALVVLAIGAVGFGVARLSGALWPSIVVMAVLAVLVLPALTSVPAVVLEGCSAWNGLGRVHRLLRENRWPGTFWLVLAVVVVPGLLALGVDLLVGVPVLERVGAVLPFWLVAVASGIAGVVPGVVIVAGQAVVLARMFLFLLTYHDGEPAFEQVVRLLPAARARRPRTPAVLAMLALPGLLYGGTVLVNPLSWLQVEETNATQTLVSTSGRSLVHPVDLRNLQAWQGPGGLMVMGDGVEGTTLLTCGDSVCHEASFAWQQAPTPWAPTASTRLADGRIARTTWTQERRRGGPDLFRLMLLICDVKGCAPAPGGRPLATTSDIPEGAFAVALAARPAGGLVVVLVRAHAGPQGESVSFVFCADQVCSHPETSRSARLGGSSVSNERALAVAIGAGDRPVAARMDVLSGAVSMISCADPGCEQARVTTPVSGGGMRRPRMEDHYRVGVSVAVREDARPVIAYRHLRDGALTLLDCRSADCARTGQAALAGPGDERMRPALVLDGAGRALVAYQDLEHRQIMLASCASTHCQRTPVGKIRQGPSDGLAMTLDSQARPVIAWTDDSNRLKEPWALKVTTVLNAEDIVAAA